MEFPGGEHPILGHAADDVDDARGSEVGPGELFLARPDDLDRPAGLARQPRRLDGRLDRVLAAVAGAGIGHDDAYGVVGQPEGPGQLAPHPERPLGAGPDGQLAVLPLRHGRAGLERGMGDVGDGVRLLEADVRGLQAIRDRAGPTVRASEAAAFTPTSAPALALPCGLLQLLEEVLARDRRAGLPFRLERGQCPGRQELAGRGHADEVAIADDDHVGHRPGRGGVERGQLRAV